MHSFYIISTTILSVYLTVESYHVDAEIAQVTYCNMVTNNSDSSSCYVRCATSTTNGIIKKLYCGDTDLCTIHCISRMCMINSIIYAENVASLQIISSAAHCLRNSTIYLPNNGDVTIHANTASYSFASTTLYSGSSTNIDIYCNGNDISTIDNIDNICNNLWLNASSAHQVNIAITSTSANGAYIECPRDINGICTINTTGEVSMKNAIIIATQSVIIYISADSDVSHSIVECNNGITIFDTITHFDTAECVGNGLHRDTTFYPSNTEHSHISNIMHIFDGFLQYILITLLTLFICLSCSILIIRRWCGGLIRAKQPRQMRQSTITAAEFRDDRVLSVGSVVDFKKILELTRSHTIDVGTISDTPQIDMRPPIITRADTVDVIRDDVSFDVPFGGFSAPCHAVTTIVEDGKHIDMDVFKSPKSLTLIPFTSNANIRKISDYIQTKRNSKKKMDIFDELKKQESVRGFAVNKLYTIYRQNQKEDVNDWSDDNSDKVEEKEIYETDLERYKKQSEGNEDVVSEASTFTVRSSIDRMMMEGNMDEIDTYALNETHGIGILDEEEEESKINDEHFRSETEGTDRTSTIPNTIGIKLPPKVTKGSYL